MTIQPDAAGATSQLVLRDVRAAIVDGRYRPGQRLLQEEIADRVGVSLAPVREALQVLQREGQVTYRPRRGFFITELHVADLVEIYGLRQVLEERAVRHTVPTLTDEDVEQIAAAADECAQAAGRGDVAAELDANRRFHFGMLDSPDLAHTTRVIRLLWDSTEGYRALYYNSPDERHATVEAHDHIVDLVRDRAVDDLVVALDEHRDRALQVLTALLDADE